MAKETLTRIFCFIFLISGKTVPVDMETTRRRVKSDTYGYCQLYSGSYEFYLFILTCGQICLLFLIEFLISPMQNELECCIDEPPISPRAPPPQPTMHVTNPGLMTTSGTSFPTAVPVVRSEQCENQAKNSVFSNALSSPIRRSLQNYQIPQGGYTSGGTTRSSEVNRGSNSPGSIDSSMDMHAE